MTSSAPASNTILDRVRCLALPLALVFLAGVDLSTAAFGDVKSDVGYSQLVSALGITPISLGGALPIGEGVLISQVEAIQERTDDNGTPKDPSDDFFIRSYMPDPNVGQFSSEADLLGENVTFTDGSGNNCGTAGPCIGFSSHATSTVGGRFYGNFSGLAPGANAVTLYEANDWINDVLRVSNGTEPISQNFRVQNLSWIGTSDSVSQDRKTLRRFDYVIDRDNVTAFVGLNNDKLDTGTVPQPELMVHSYNAIAVGRTDGLHSSGPTLIVYGPGRTKPDIVVPVTTASAATAHASSAAALLHEVVAGTNAANSEVMKAMLLAGATKEEFAGWSHTTTQPLDSEFGAGELNVYNSYLMTQGGQTLGTTDPMGGPILPVDSYGWGYQTVSPGGDLFYNFNIPTGSTATELSIILAWNVEVEDSSPGSQFSGSESLADLDLGLYNSSGSLIDESVSSVDSVEHIYQTDLGPGTYMLKVSTDSERDFGLAWRMSTLFDTPSADFDEDGDVDGFDFMTWQRNRGTLLGAAHADGDADGDGDVDSDDMTVLNLEYGTTAMVVSVSAGVPEPSTVGLALLAAGFLPLFLRTGRSAISSRHPS